MLQRRKISGDYHCEIFLGLIKFLVWLLELLHLSLNQQCQQNSWLVPNVVQSSLAIEKQKPMLTKLLLNLGIFQLSFYSVIIPFSGHMGPVYHISRNPSFPKIFLTVGDWTARVWSEDIKDASILSSQVEDLIDFLTDTMILYFRQNKLMLLMLAGHQLAREYFSRLKQMELWMFMI